MPARRAGASSGGLEVTACLVAERDSPYGHATTGEPSGSLEIFIRGPRELSSSSFPRAELYVLPARLYLDLLPAERPAPAFAYGRLGFAAEALAAGALDYLLEPWELPELEARAKGRLAQTLRLGSLRLEPAERSLRSERGELRLSEAEFRALRLLVLAPEGLVTRAALGYSLWGETRRGSRAADVLVSELRKKLEALAGPAELEIKALRGVGYRLLRKTCA